MNTRGIQGTAVSPGLAQGPVCLIVTHSGTVPTWTVPENEVEDEIKRLHGALRQASEDLQIRQKMVAAQTGEKEADIFGVQRMVLQDPGALAQVEGAIREQRVNAEAAVQALIERFARTLGRLEGDSVRSYAADFSDPWRRVVEALEKREKAQVQLGGEPVVLVAGELTPQVAAYLPRERILAVVCESGGRFSHGAVLVRSLGVPCVVGIPNLLARLEQGLKITVDGNTGQVQLRPDAELLRAFDERRLRFEARRASLAEHAGEPCQTRDGVSFGVSVNIESVRDLDVFDVTHCDGVGLLRTEFLYMERPQFPSAEEQYRLYRRVLERMAGRPVTMRTLDIGGDKQLPYFKTPRENNPALGWRGLRISLEWRDLLRVQLQALLRASVHGELRILLPMVSSLDEVQETHRIFDSVKQELLAQGYDVAAQIPVGIMIEVPSAFLTLSHMIEEVDFISVGTNDLVQYLLAVDRDNAWVSRLYDPQHPAVGLALEQVAKVARAAGTSCSVCGDMAGDPATALMLLGMGFDSVSVAPHFLPEIKYAVRRSSLEEAQSCAREVLQQHSADGVKRVLSAVRSRLYDA